MDYDGLISLGDAQVRAATAQAGIATTLADIPQKLAQADRIQQEAIHQHLENIAKFLEIRWDAEAHQNLVRTRTIALQKARQHTLEAERFAGHVRRLTWLMSGSCDYTAAVHGWIALHYVLHHLPVTAMVAAMEQQPEPAAYEPGAWKHPNNKQLEYTGDRDGGSLMAWAMKMNCYPRSGSAAWGWLAGMIAIAAEQAKAEAAKLDAITEKATAEARAIQQFSWKRLEK